MGCLISLQFNGSRWHLACGGRSFNKILWSNSTAVSVSWNHDSVPSVNPQTLLWAVSCKDCFLSSNGQTPYNLANRGQNFNTSGGLLLLKITNHKIVFWVNIYYATYGNSDLIQDLNCSQIRIKSRWDVETAAIYLNNSLMWLSSALETTLIFKCRMHHRGDDNASVVLQEQCVPSCECTSRPPREATRCCPPSTLQTSWKHLWLHLLVQTSVLLVFDL